MAASMDVADPQASEHEEYDPVVRKLLGHAESLAAAFKFEAAVQFYERALQIVPSDGSILEDLGTIYLELGEPEKARETLLRAVEASPESCTVSLLNLAQISEGDEALRFFREAERLLVAAVEHAPDDRNVRATAP